MTVRSESWMQGEARAREATHNAARACMRCATDITESECDGGRERLGRSEAGRKRKKVKRKKKEKERKRLEDAETEGGNRERQPDRGKSGRKKEREREGEGEGEKEGGRES